MRRATRGRARLLAVALASVAVAACGTSEASEGPSLQTSNSIRGDLRITAEATGTVEPIRQVEVKSKAGGEILRLHVDVGDEVSTGSDLARVDPRDVRNSFDQAQADMEVAQARLEIAEAQLQRSRELLGSGVITRQEFESANLEGANARAAAVKAQTNLELAQLRLGDVTIRAPMAGTILSKTVEEGQVIQSASSNVSGGTTLFIMANLDEMQVRTLVDETDMGEIRAGMPADVTVEAYPDRVFQGFVEKIEPQAVVNQNVTMFPVIVRLDNRSGLLRPGMNAEVEVLIDQASDIVLVPNNAVVLLEDVGPAAMTLGLDVESMDLSQFRARGTFAGAGGGDARGPRGPADARGGAAAGGAPSPAGEGGPAPAAAGAPGDDARRARFDSLRARVERGEISQDSARALMASARGGRGGDGAGAAAGSGGRQLRRAVVFVVDSAGVPAPRVVQIGLNDWDHTEVVSGLEEGEQVALIGAAQLQQRQQEFRNRMRSRMGGPFGG